ncbi:sulfur oxidation c-type cytochrome SoxA [Roseobacter denitrificans]|uniref:SoxAX cytochrome complex subunit A n=1 Tax=Roseobacter denitrificans (strain ATCC 33942 / OCh 114) TaxID=375451 RepID=Q16A46_ROSDO|nr:sulfur oxidation c-type cytochrome SoxA [Roseobacter denitrificans]ABG31147.1 diheme cytochrome c SoxA [Roseobacter denitrificans OCh 114]AVL54213.1 sulfur oxidation c-type cytochrome SoxA [Roseobacter denitrificans]SFG32263.1 sulfur-oxidizing protein SoxA [Roseobacter denitrificans OCh 114]
MRRITSAVLATFLTIPGAFAEPVDDQLVVNEDISIVTRTAAPAHVSDALDEVMSGWLFRGTETRAMQADDFDNPGMIFVEQALEVWETAEGTEGKSCAACHNDIDSMAGVKATYPKWNEAAGEVRTLQMQVNDCRTNRMGAEAWKYDSGDAINMEAALASVSRGMPVNVAIDGPAQSAWELGKELYYTRTGQLELSCSNCHEDNYGMMIRADHLSQGQINGFPVYRLKNTKLNGVHSRFKGCVRDTRAETYSPGSAEFVALELYVASRGNGLSVEGPSVRN